MEELVDALDVRGLAGDRYHSVTLRKTQSARNSASQNAPRASCGDTTPYTKLPTPHRRASCVPAICDVPVADCIYIGDDKRDIEAARVQVCAPSPRGMDSSHPATIPAS